MDQLSPNVLHLGPKRDPILLFLLPTNVGAWRALFAGGDIPEVVQSSEDMIEVAIEP